LRETGARPAGAGGQGEQDDDVSERPYGVETAVTRVALRRGASQIKIAVGGGTGSYADPLDVVEFTPEEIPTLKVVHGTDIFLDPGDGYAGGVKQMERLLKWFTPYEILKMSTSKPAEMLKLSGPRNPYPGDLGVVKEGAYADLLLVEGNRLKDLKVVTDRENLKIIMKDGKIYKNTTE